MNHPGAAAQPRPPASTGFRPVNATSGFGSPPNAPNPNSTNTYQFVMCNPVGYADPLGTYVIALTSPGETDGYGHAAVLVGNSGSGWTYYSKNAPGNGSASGNTQQWYPNLNAFWNAQSKAEHNKTNHAQRYPNEMRIPECKGRTANMNKEAKAIVNEPYS
jgi:hypothetical protein